MAITEAGIDQNTSTQSEIIDQTLSDIDVFVGNLSQLREKLETRLQIEQGLIARIPEPAPGQESPEDKVIEMSLHVRNLELLSFAIAFADQTEVAHQETRTQRLVTLQTFAQNGIVPQNLVEHIASFYGIQLPPKITSDPDVRSDPETEIGAPPPFTSEPVQDNARGDLAPESSHPRKERGKKELQKRAERAGAALVSHFERQSERLLDSSDLLEATGRTYRYSAYKAHLKEFLLGEGYDLVVHPPRNKYRRDLSTFELVPLKPEREDTIIFSNSEPATLIEPNELEDVKKNSLASRLFRNFLRVYGNFSQVVSRKDRRPISPDQRMSHEVATTFLDIYELDIVDWIKLGDSIQVPYKPEKSYTFAEISYIIGYLLTPKPEEVSVEEQSEADTAFSRVQRWAQKMVKGIRSRKQKHIKPQQPEETDDLDIPEDEDPYEYLDDVDEEER